MTTNTTRGPARARTIITATATFAVALTLAACRCTGAAQATPPTATPSGNATLTPTPTIPAMTDHPTVYGTLNVVIALTTPDSKIPGPALSYLLAVKPRGADASVAYPVDPDGTFALPLEPGSYEMTFVEIEAADLGSQPVAVPLEDTKTLLLQAPATGCSYGGEVDVVYGRLPAGTQQQQQDLVARASRNNNQNYSFVYRPDGGFVLAGATVSLPPATKRPSAAQSCVASQFVLA